MNSKSNEPKPSGSSQLSNKTQVFILTPEMLRKMGIASQIPNLEHVTKSGQKSSKPQIDIVPDTTPKRKIELKQKLLEKIKRTENTNKIQTNIPTNKQEISQDQITKNVETTPNLLKVKPDQSSIDKPINISPNRVRRQSKQLDNKIDIDESASIRKSTRKRKLSNLLDDFVTDLKIYDGYDQKNPTRRSSVTDKDIKIVADIKIEKPINKIDKIPTSKSLKLSNEEDLDTSINVFENILTPSKPLRTYSRNKKRIIPNLLNIKPKQTNQTNITLDAPANSKLEVSEPQNLPSTIDSINSILKSESDILISQEITRFQPGIAETSNFKSIFDELYNEPTTSFMSEVSKTPTTSSNGDPVQNDLISCVDNQRNVFISQIENNSVIDSDPISDIPILLINKNINDNTSTSLISTSEVAEIRTEPLNPTESSNILIVIPDKIEMSELETALENTLKYIKNRNLNKSMKLENSGDENTLIQTHKLDSSLLQNAFEEISTSSNFSTITNCETNENTNVSILETNINEVTNLTQYKATCKTDLQEHNTPILNTNIPLLEKSTKNVEEPTTNIVILPQTKEETSTTNAPILETDKIETPTELKIRETIIEHTKTETSDNSIDSTKIDVSLQNVLKETKHSVTSHENKTNENKPNISVLSDELDTNKSLLQKETNISASTNLNKITEPPLELNSNDTKPNISVRSDVLDTNKSLLQKETNILSPTNLNQITEPPLELNSNDNKPKITHTLKTLNSATDISVASETNKTIETQDSKVPHSTKNSLLQKALEKSIPIENTKTEPSFVNNTCEQTNVQTLESTKMLQIDNNESIINEIDSTNEINDTVFNKGTPESDKTFDALKKDSDKEHSDNSTDNDVNIKQVSNFNTNLERELKCASNKTIVIDNEIIPQNKEVTDNSIMDKPEEYSDSDVDQNIFDDDTNIELEDSDKESLNEISSISLSKTDVIIDSNISENSKLLIITKKLEEEIGEINSDTAISINPVNTETMKEQITSETSPGEIQKISKLPENSKLQIISKEDNEIENIKVTQEIKSKAEKSENSTVKIISNVNNEEAKDINSKDDQTNQAIKLNPIITNELKNISAIPEVTKNPENMNLIEIATDDAMNINNNTEITQIIKPNETPKLTEITKQDIVVSEEITPPRRGRKPKKTLDSPKVLNISLSDCCQPRKRSLVKKDEIKIKESESDEEHKRKVQKIDPEQILVKKKIDKTPVPKQTSSDNEKSISHKNDKSLEVKDKLTIQKYTKLKKTVGRSRRTIYSSSDNEESAKETTNEPLDSDEECKAQNSKKILTKKKIGRQKKITHNSSDSRKELKTDDTQDYDEEIPVKTKGGRPRKMKLKTYGRQEKWKTEKDDSEPEEKFSVVKKTGGTGKIKRSSSDTELSSAEQKTDDSQRSDEEIPKKEKAGRLRKIKPDTSNNKNLIKQKVYDTQDSDVECKTEKDDSELEQKMPVKKQISESQKIKQKSLDNGASITKDNIKSETTDDEVIAKGTESAEEKVETRIYGKGRPRKSTIKPKMPTIIKGMVTCAVCKEKLKQHSWPAHKLKHNNLAWLVGADEIDLNNTAEVSRILQKLTKTKKKLSCTECGHKSKSVVGYLSHLDQCKKSKAEILADRIPCPICKKMMLPVSLKVHVGVWHKKEQKTKQIKPIELDTIQINTPNTPARLKREAARKAFDLIQEVSLEDDDIPKKSFLKKSYRKMADPPKPTVFSFFWKSFTKNDSFACKIKSCTFTTKTLKELREHTNICSQLKPSDYVCSYCLFISVTEQSMIAHVKAKHLKKPDYEPDGEYEEDGEEDEEEENYEFEEVTDKFVRKVRNPLTNKKFTYKVAFLAKEKRMLPSVVCTYPAAARWTKEFYEENYLEDLFKNIKLFKDDYIQLTSKEQMKYLPHLKQSMAVKEFIVSNTVPNLQGREHIWKHYGLYESTVNDDIITIFCGGPIWALAWAPTPFTQISDQILGVSVQKSTRQNYKIGKSYTGEESIQFWNFGPLNHKKLMIDHPKLEFTLTHTHGMVWHMEWCPSGCYEDSGCNYEDSCKNNSSDLLNRLGLLALACSDGNIVIYAIPSPFNNSQKFYKTKEKYRLITQNSTEIKLGLWDDQVTKLSWSKSKGHNYIAGGYSNGLVSVWNLDTKSPLLKFDDEGTIVLKPFLTFQAHVSAISAIVLHPLDGGKRWLFTGSWDKSTKYWDLNNISTTISSVKKGLTTDGVWMTHWLTSFVTYDDVFNLSHTVTTAQNARDYYYKQSSAMACNSMVNAISGNDWANAFAQVSIAGQLSGSFPRQMLMSFDEKGMKCKRVLFGYTELIDKTLQPNERIIKIEKTSTKKALDFSDKDDKYIFQYLMNKDENKFEDEPDTYEEAQQKYGMIFCDINLLKFEKVPKETQNWVRQSNRMPHAPLELYPLMSINRVAWNPNLQSYLYLGTGYQTGFVRIRCVRFMHTKYTAINI